MELEAQSLVGGVSLGVMGLGLLVSFAGSLWFVVRAFGVSVWWGLLTLFCWPVQFVFLVVHWQRAKVPFLWALAGTAVMLAPPLVLGVVAPGQTPFERLRRGAVPTQLVDRLTEDGAGEGSATEASGEDARGAEVRETDAPRPTPPARRSLRTIYAWTDARGTVRLTDDPASVAQRFHDSLRLATDAEVAAATGP